MLTVTLTGVALRHVRYDLSRGVLIAFIRKTWIVKYLRSHLNNGETVHCLLIVVWEF